MVPLFRMLHANRNIYVFEQRLRFSMSLERQATKKRKQKQDGSNNVDENELTQTRKRSNIEVIEPFANPCASDFLSQDFNTHKTNTNGLASNFKIASWNVAGLRAWIKKGGMEYLEHEKPDILCLQETKCLEADLPDMEALGYVFKSFYCTKGGHAGVAILAKINPITSRKGLEEEHVGQEDEFGGRIIAAEFDQFYLVNTYVPMSGRKTVGLPKRMVWDKILRDHLRKLDAVKPVILCGDLNVAHLEIDIFNPDTHRRSPGFTQEERDSFGQLLAECDFVDTFRHFNPNQAEAYTFWSYRSLARGRNAGWRLDYFIVSRRFLPNVSDIVIRHQVFGSDHCPLVCFLRV